MSEAAPSQSNDPRPVAPVLSAEQLRELDDARLRWQRVQRAVRVAVVSGWLLACAAAFSLLVGIWSIESAVLGVMLAGVAVVEFIGKSKMRRADPRAPLLLGWNQLLLIGLFGAFAVYQVFLNAPPPAPQSVLLTEPAVRDLLESNGYGQLLESARDTGPLRTLAYAAGAVVVLLTQLPLALYYFSRRRVVEVYLRATPAWVVEVQRRAA